MHISSVKKITVAVAAAASAITANITFLPLPVSAANAGPQPGGTPMGPHSTILRSWATGRCLDSNFAGHVYTLPCQSGNRHQEWRISSSGRFVQNVATSMCLATNRPAAIYTTDCVNTNWTMDWSIRERAPRVFVFTHRTSAQCLDSNHAGNAYTHACGSNYQDWKNGF